MQFSTMKNQMFSQQLREMWERFDDLAAQSASPDIREAVEALKAQTGDLMAKVAAIEALDAAPELQATTADPGAAA
jgi:hypothetical protein